MTNPYAKLGDHNYHCDECFRTVKASTLRKRWDNAYVCDRCYEKRNPAEYKTYKAKSKLASPTSQSTESLGTTSTRSFTVTDSSSTVHSYTCGKNITLKQFNIARSIPAVNCSLYSSYTTAVPSSETTIFGDSTVTNNSRQGQVRTLALNSDGTILASGVPGSSHYSTGGSVTIYSRTGSSWAVTQRIANAAATQNSFDNFGTSVAMSLDGSVLVVGAPGETGTGSPTTDGRVFVYTGSGGTYTLSHNIGPSDDPAVADFGYDVSLSGDGVWLVVAAVGVQQAYVFKRTNGVYVESKILIPSVSPTEYGIAASISLDGNYIATTDYADNSNEGRVYIHYKDQGGSENWGEQQTFTAGFAWNGGAEQFGSDVALSCDGTYLAVGCMAANRVSGANSSGANEGAWEIWKRTGDTWAFLEAGETQGPNSSTNGLMGWEMAIASDGQYILASGPEADNGSANAGAVEMAVNNGSDVYVINNVFPTSRSDMNFGSGMALSADNKVLVVGASDNDTYATNGGALYYFVVAT